MDLVRFVTVVAHGRELSADVFSLLIFLPNLIVTLLPNLLFSFAGSLNGSEFEYSRLLSDSSKDALCQPNFVVSCLYLRM